MKQWLRPIMLLAIPIAAWGCKSDPTVTNDIGTPSKLVASPSTVFVAQGASEATSVTLVDANGNPVPGTFTLTPPSDANFTVVQDTSQLLIYDAAGNSVQRSSQSSARYTITANGFGATSFQVTSGSLTTTINVSSYPATLPATFNTGTPAVGQTVTVTAPAGTFFRPTSTIAFAGVADARIISRAADSSSITFLVQPGTNGVATISNVGVRSSPTLSFTVPTIATVKLPAPTTFIGTINTTTPAAGQTVILTGTGFKVSPAATVTVGGTPAISITTAADSSTLSFIPAPGSSGIINVTGAAANGFALGLLPTTLSLTAGSGAVTKIAGTDALGTAPTLNVAAGRATGFIDAPPFGYLGTGCTTSLGDPCNVYKIVTTTANQKFTVTLDWNNTSDLGLYVLNSAGALVAGAGNADAGGTGASGHPENATLTFATPGTYYLAVLRFTYAGSTVDPTYYTVQITGL